MQAVLEGLGAGGGDPVKNCKWRVVKGTDQMGCLNCKETFQLGDPKGGMWLLEGRPCRRGFVVLNGGRMREVETP